METKHLTIQQLEHISERVAWSLRYFGKLRDRMQRCGFMPTDELYMRVDASYNEVHHFSVKLHYLLCEKRKQQWDREKYGRK